MGGPCCDLCCGALCVSGCVVPPWPTHSSRVGPGAVLFVLLGAESSGVNAGVCVCVCVCVGLFYCVFRFLLSSYLCFYLFFYVVALRVYF